MSFIAYYSRGQGERAGSPGRGSRAHGTRCMTPTWLLSSSAQHALCLGWGPQYSGS